MSAYRILGPGAERRRLGLRGDGAEQSFGTPSTVFSRGGGCRRHPREVKVPLWTIVLVPDPDPELGKRRVRPA